MEKYYTKKIKKV